MRRRVSPALVVSVVALVLAGGGTALAGRYLITSTKQIKPAVLKKLKGKQGPQGPAGAAVTRTTVVRSKSVPQDQVVKIDATCPAGFVLTGGGVAVGGNQLIYAAGIDDRTYEVALGNVSSLASVSGSAQAF